MFNFFRNNKNQIALISVEFPPIIKASGMGDNNRDFTICHKSLYPNKEIRVILPYYDCDTFKQAQDTGIEFEFYYGVQKSKAEIFKIISEGITVYCIKSDAFSYFKKPYEYKGFELLTFCSAFSNSAIIALEELSKDKKESFKPTTLHLTDWHTSLNGKRRKTSFLKNKKIIHAIHNIGSGYQGCTMPFYGMLLFFEKAEIEFCFFVIAE